MAFFVVRVVRLERSMQLWSVEAETVGEAMREATKMVRENRGLPVGEPTVRVYADTVYDGNGSVVQWRPNTTAPWNRGREFKED